MIPANFLMRELNPWNMALALGASGITFLGSDLVELQQVVSHSLADTLRYISEFGIFCSMGPSCTVDIPICVFKGYAFSHSMCTHTGIAYFIST